MRNFRLIRKDAKRLQSNLGKENGEVLDQYLTNVRKVEQRLADGVDNISNELCGGARPPAEDLTFTEDLSAKVDLLALAFQCGITRVGTMLLDFEGGDRYYYFLVRVPKNTTIQNLNLTLIQKMGIQQESFFGVKTDVKNL